MSQDCLTVFEVSRMLKVVSTKIEGCSQIPSLVIIHMHINAGDREHKNEMKVEKGATVFELASAIGLSFS